jgi:hypothetical protein
VITARRVAAATVAVVLAVLAGTGLWVRFADDETPGSHRVTVSVPRGNDGVVAFRLDRYRDAPAPVSDIVTVGAWEERPPGTLRLESGAGRAAYRGVVEERVEVRFSTGPDGGRARIVRDGDVGPIVSLQAPEEGTRTVVLRFDASVPGASWALLALMIAVSVAVTSAAVWAANRVGARRGPRAELGVVAGGAATVAIVALAPYSSPEVVREQGGVLPVLDHLGLGIVVGVAVVLLAAFVLGVRAPAPPGWVTAPETARDRWRVTALLASVPFVGWLALQLLFWPGLMNPDMVEQWVQLDRTGLDDWHPYVVAIVVGALRYVVDSPALPVLLQVVGASLLVGRIAAWTVWRGRSPWIAGALLVLLPVLPPTGLFTVTLWKDTPFGLALLALVLVVWRIEDTKGEWLRERRNVVLTVVTALGLLLSRHNAWPILLATLVVLLVVHRAWWRRFAVAAAATFGVVLLVQLPLAAVLDVRASRVQSIVYVQHLANHVNRGTDLEPSERRLLRSIYPLDRTWPYSCHTIQPTWSGPDGIPLTRFTDKSSELRSLALELALRDPAAELDHLACASELVWNPGDDDQATYFLEWSNTSGHVDYIPRVYDETPTEQSASPRAINRIYDVVTDVLPIWVIRPALYLYAFAAAIAFAAWRRRSWGVVWIAVPVIVQSLVLAALTLVQDVRFQYGVMLAAVVLVPALFTVAKRSACDDDLPLRWARRAPADPPT